MPISDPDTNPSEHGTIIHPIKSHSAFLKVKIKKWIRLKTSIDGFSRSLITNHTHFGFGQDYFFFKLIFRFFLNLGKVYIKWDKKIKTAWDKTLIMTKIDVVSRTPKTPRKPLMFSGFLIFTFKKKGNKVKCYLPSFLHPCTCDTIISHFKIHFYSLDFA